LPSPQLWPSFESLQAQLEQWQRDHPRFFSLQTRGRSAQGRALLSARITDPGAADEQKEHVVVTCLHSGIERSGTTSAFAIMEWLLSEDPVAREVRRRQVVVFMPIVNPDGYVLGTHATTTGGDPYGGWTLDGPRAPDTTPESVAVQQLMDLYQPEVHADIHGLDLSFPGYMSLENSGASYSNLALRPWDSRIAEAMDEAALEEGFPSERLEQDAERLFWGPELEPISHQLWSGRPRPYAALYCYSRYHSLVLASEAMWTRSGFLRHRRLLEIGNAVQPGEHYPGYPTRVVMSNTLHQLVAYGATAAERRRSRVELWGKQRGIVHGMVNPQKTGLAAYVCATSPEGARRLGDRSLKGFLANLDGHPAVEPQPIRDLFADYPEGPGQWGGQPNLYLTGGGDPSASAQPIEHGIAFRLRIPYPKARLLDLRLNGHVLPPSEAEGYQTWRAKGYVYVQVNVPPQRSRAEDLFIVTCRYGPGEKRVEGWRPSA
jgi:hypothetical protein